MDVFVIGATGYIGGSVATRLVAAGHRVRGLVRDPAKVAALAATGVVPVSGEVADAGLLAREARAGDAVVNAADSDDRDTVEALIAALAGSGKALVHTSGTSVVADDGQGEGPGPVIDEKTPWTPVPAKAARAAIDRLVVEAAARGVRSIVLCNPLIYGTGLGLHKDSIQVPTLARIARERGTPHHVGAGRNVWSNVHVEDMADLYLLALERAPAGSFCFVENGEASFAEITAAIGRALGLGEPVTWPLEEAVQARGEQRARWALASNSRVRARRARAELGWAPRHGSVVAWIERELSRR